jgi:isoquinoline 1-oxidoreductase alpha subunit
LNLSFDKLILKGQALMITLNINGKDQALDVEPEMPLLWALREVLGMTGTKFGCGIAQCGSCTVHMNGTPVRSCSIPAAAMVGQKITTIEGLSADSTHAIQKAWAAVDVPQCGYCQSGQIMAAAALLKEKPQPTDADIDAAMTNICRCGTYQRIRAAIHLAAGNKKMAAANGYTGEFTGVHAAEHTGAQAFQVLAANEIKAANEGAQA